MRSPIIASRQVLETMNRFAFLLAGRFRLCVLELPEFARGAPHAFTVGQQALAHHIFLGTPVVQ